MKFIPVQLIFVQGKEAKVSKPRNLADPVSLLHPSAGHLLSSWDTEGWLRDTAVPAAPLQAARSPGKDRGE